MQLYLEFNLHSCKIAIYEHHGEAEILRGACPERCDDIVRGVYSERSNEILRFAQNDKGKAQHDMQRAQHGRM